MMTSNVIRDELQRREGKIPRFDAERLGQLKFLLGNLATELPNMVEFRMANWCGPTTEDWKEERKMVLAQRRSVVHPPEPPCRTAACALGSAALWKPFRKMGLKLRRENIWSNFFYPVYRGADRFFAAMDFFGLTWNEAVYIFGLEYYRRVPIDAADVLAHIDVVIKRHKGEHT